jgi:hypothetical protein
MIAHDGGQCTSSAYLFNDLGQPPAAGLRVFDTPHLLTGIDHETITQIRERKLRFQLRSGCASESLESESARLQGRLKADGAGETT